MSSSAKPPQNGGREREAAPEYDRLSGIDR